MDKYCPITREVSCKCGKYQTKIPSWQVNLKLTLRKLFTDHAVYTKFVINGIIGIYPNVPAMTQRLLSNQIDIGDQLKPIIGDSRRKELTDLLTKHIILAADVITITSSNKAQQELQIAVNNLFENSDQVAAFLTSLNPEKLPYHFIKTST